ncbi:hypothetical protein F5Y13DRAFT_201635 [Hypoxylon sp. FL1857]|nr:hypothetical protein F5Y13DRAFT_201635 [Hypoxylon sp. FL1857]
MSFGFAVGDVIAVLGLFERISVEIRNYKNAPAHFQRLSVKLDLLRSALQRVLQQSPDNETEGQTLEQIRAIVIHCMCLLQTLADKMQAKEGRLGHFRTTRSLGNIGTRLHWSMIAQKDVDEILKTIKSEMVAINTLLLTQHLGNTKREYNSISKQIDIRSDALMKQTSLIIGLVSATPSTIVDLGSMIKAQADRQSQQANAQSQDLITLKSQVETMSSNFSEMSTAVGDYAGGISRASRRLFQLMDRIKRLLVFLSTCTQEMLDAIRRNTRALLNIASHMKRIQRAIDAIPLHLSVDIIRLDDALGETWGLPFQACGTWWSFDSFLRDFVFANGRRGANQIQAHQYIIALHGTGQRIEPLNWQTTIKAGAHIEQFMIVNTINHTGNKCLKPGCTGSVEEGVGENPCRVCSSCRQRVTSEKRWQTISNVHTQWDEDAPQRQIQAPLGRPVAVRPQPFLPPIWVDEVQHFQRIHVCELELIERIYNPNETSRRSQKDKRDFAANLCMGRFLLRLKEEIPWVEDVQDPIPYLTTAITIGGFDPEPWYLLARSRLHLRQILAAYEAMQQAVRKGNGRSPTHWITVGILYYENYDLLNSLEALARAIRLDPCIWQSWFNITILYDACGQHEDSLIAYERCLQLKSNLPDVKARLGVLRNHDPQNVTTDHRIYRMRDTPLEASR